ncbi:hypothetical protein V5P93_003799 [Actinokineospora auranticolor]|uniref:hypothetical protein n=1 Tax=Actinokineospora auranticolor TaxID=155976 RepID=UPI0011B05FBE|nr:hypothetical protein [Actinokineospora auranticolor]
MRTAKPPAAKTVVFVAIYLVAAVLAMTFLHDKVPGIGGMVGGLTGGLIVGALVKRHRRDDSTPSPLSDCRGEKRPQ